MRSNQGSIAEGEKLVIKFVLACFAVPLTLLLVAYIFQ